MSNTDTLNLSQSLAQHLHLNVAQVQSALSILSQNHSLAYCYQYGLVQNGRLSLAQWYRLNTLFSQAENSALGLSARFMAHDNHFLQQFSLSPTLKAFAISDLMAIIDHLLSHSDTDMHAFVTTSLNLNPEDNELVEQVIQDLHGVLFCKLMQQPDFLHQQRQVWLQHVAVNLRAPQKPQESIAELQSQWPNPSPLFKKFPHGLATRYFELKKSHAIHLEFVFAQDPEFPYQQILQTLQGYTYHSAIPLMVKQITENILAKLFYRDLNALLYEQAVESLLPVLELKLSSFLAFQGIGSHAMVLIYPHGRSGVMLLTLDAKGEVLDETMVYPNAPDYDAEHTLSHLAKMVVKYNAENMALIVKPETSKGLLKTLKTLQSRYPDFHLKVTMVPGDFTKVFQTTQQKHPVLEDVLQMAHFVQNPLLFWRKINVVALLPHIMNFLPASLVQSFWQEMVSIAVYKKGVDIQHASLDELQHVLSLTADQAQKMMDLRPFSNRLDIVERGGLSPQQAACFRFGQPGDIEASALLIEDTAERDALAQSMGCSTEELAHLSIDESKANTLEQQRVIRLLRETQDLQKQPRILSLESSQALDSIPSGTLFLGVITKIMNYGLFVELAKGVEGLVHISTFGDVFVGDLSRLFSPGELMVVEWAHFDAPQKRISLRYPGVTQKVTLSTVMEKTRATHKHKPKTIHKKTKPEKLVVESSLKEPSAMQLAFAKLKGTTTSSS